tara:strand:+ start:519 stop:1394 length:876 start_codon:yes stop_codon:yes gene_type:complete
MSISRQNLSIVIVTLRSENIIDRCLTSINQDIPIIIVENSNNVKFKEYLESKYKNLKCILSGSNLGMGAGNNIGIKTATTDYVYILNPDTVLETNSLNEIFLASKKISNFSILSPINSNINYPNYKINKNQKKPHEKDVPFKVDYIDGFSMLLNKKKFKDNNYFDENFFLYLENNDLCLRVKKKGENIFIIPSASIKHQGASTVDLKFKEEVELSRNWHWIWSKFYFNKKHKGYLYAFFTGIPYFLSATLKFILYLILNNRKKKQIYLQRISGFLTAVMGKKSYYRPTIKN